MRTCLQGFLELHFIYALVVVDVHHKEQCFDFFFRIYSNIKISQRFSQLSFGDKRRKVLRPNLMMSPEPVSFEAHRVNHTVLSIFCEDTADSIDLSFLKPAMYLITNCTRVDCTSDLVIEILHINKCAKSQTCLIR
jgi:hypothetical protein